MNVKNTRGNVMSELMNEYENTENKYGKDNVKYC